MTDDAIETVEHRGYTCALYYDPDAEDPHDEDYFVTKMALSHRRYDLPNDAEVDFDAFDGWEEVRAHLIAEHGALMVRPVYGHDHGGLRLSAGSKIGPDFEWDGGIAGLAWIDQAAIDRTGMPDDAATMEANIVSEVELYDRWANGEFVGYTVTDDATGEEVDACWGFDDDAYAMTEARSVADSYADDRDKAAEEAQAALEAEAGRLAELGLLEPLAALRAMRAARLVR